VREAFGAAVAGMVDALTEDESIAGHAARKAQLRRARLRRSGERPGTAAARDRSGWCQARGRTIEG
jgi:hypothetical protein